MRRSDTVVIDRSACDAFLFDLDGVIARTGGLHAAAWKRRRVTDVADIQGGATHRLAPSIRVLIDGEIHEVGASETRGFVLK